MRNAWSLFCICDFWFWQDTTIPLGMWVIRTAESVVLTDSPPGPEDRNTSMVSRSFGSRLTSSASSAGSGITSTPAAEVWIRP